MKNVVGTVCLAVVAFAVAGPAWAQNPLAGSWEQFSQQVNGKEMRDSSWGRLIMVFDQDNHLGWFYIPKDRPKATKKAADMTREELVAEFGEVAGGFGSCEITQDKITFKGDHTAIRTNEPDDPGYTFRVEGDVLIFKQDNPKGEKLEIRYRRLK